MLTSLAFLTFLALTTDSKAQPPTPTSGKLPGSRVGRPTAATPVPIASQRDTPLTWIPVPQQDGLFYMAQQSNDERLILTADESFFPNLGLAATGKGSSKDIAGLNKGDSFASISKWDKGDTAEWGLFLKQTGEIDVRVWCSATGPPGKFQLRLGESSASFTTGSGGDPKVASGRLKVDSLGFHLLQLRCNQPGTDCKVMAIELSGPTTAGGAVLRKRWRPAAAHTKFTSSAAPDKVRLWVMEMDAQPGDLAFYCPITTPFGYYGPTWRADGKVNTGFNFSLWSFGRGKQAPPIEQLSHLLAAGNRSASLDGFDHEGTGVKIRDWQPLEGRQGQRQALALRVEPGTPYDTYYSYFYASDEKRWRLFGIGNKYNKGVPLKSLFVGSFVEVPGRSSVQRTGIYPRVMRYRGWCMDTDGKWHALDRMTNGNINKDTGLTHTHRGITDDGWFFLQTGGWTFRSVTNPSDIQNPHTLPIDRIAYLSNDDIAALTSTPSAIHAEKIHPTEQGIACKLMVRNLGENPTVTLFWGVRDSLTFADRWQHNTKLTGTHDGANHVTLPVEATQRPLFMRLRLENDEGIFWSTETYQVIR